MADLIMINLSYECDEKECARFQRLGGQGCVDALTNDIRAACDRFTDEVRQIQQDHSDRLARKLMRNVVKLNR